MTHKTVTYQDGMMHILRNPYGFSEEIVREARLAAGDYIEALERELRVERVKNLNSLANNLCPDHRDKQSGKSCLACRIEQLERKPDRVVVPAEVTPEMQRAYFAVIDKNLRRVETDPMFGRHESAKEAYRAMLAAAP